MTIDTSGFNDKASREPRFMSLYEQHDYLEAYAKHTDMRVADDPRWAIGRGDEWESHGAAQKAFLVEQGMKRTSQVLDIGCGTGRAARKLVPWLAPGCYTGVDISPGAIGYSQALAKQEGWASQDPRFLLSTGETLPVDGPFDIVWAHSVFTHLPDWAIRAMVGEVKRVLAPGGAFVFTYKHAAAPARTGLKQFKYPFDFFAQVAQEQGLTARALTTIWPASQRTGRIRWGATASMQ